MDRGSGTGQIVDLVHFQGQGGGDVVADQLEIGFGQEICDVVAEASEQIVQTQDVMALLNQSLTEMGAKKSSPSRHQNALMNRHG